MERTFLEIGEYNLDYYRRTEVRRDRIQNLEIILVTFFFLFISIVIAFGQLYDYRPIVELNKFKRINN